jgi:hypothetical protein
MFSSSTILHIFLCDRASFPGVSPQGTAFCFVPLPILTGLPVHVHACFLVTKNRRGLWTAGTGVDGIHQFYVDWNSHLLRVALPRLYADMLEANAAPQAAGRSLENYYRLWPNADLVTTDAGFGAVVPSVYQELRGRLVLPIVNDHGQLGICFEDPEKAIAFTTRTDAQEQLRHKVLCMCCSEELMGSFSGPVVQLPSHVQAALSKFLGLQVTRHHCFLSHDPNNDCST